MEEQLKLGFQFAADLSIHLITLSTAVLGLSITFSKEVIPDKMHMSVSKPLIRSWILYLASIICGIWSLMALTGSLAPISTEDPAVLAGIGANARVPAGLQIGLFVAGTLLQIQFGRRALGEFKSMAQDAETKEPDLASKRARMEEST